MNQWISEVNQSEDRFVGRSVDQSVIKKSIWYICSYKSFKYLTPANADRQLADSKRPTIPKTYSLSLCTLQAYTYLQNLKSGTAYLKSKQLLYLGFAQQYGVGGGGYTNLGQGHRQGHRSVIVTDLSRPLTIHGHILDHVHLTSHYPPHGRPSVSWSEPPPPCSRTLTGSEWFVTIWPVLSLWAKIQ